MNYDSSPRLRIERLPIFGRIIRKSGYSLFPEGVRYGDIVRGLPVNNGSISGIYCSHVLEHLDRSSVVKALTNTLELLKPGGVFRLVVPDLAWRAKLYIDSYNSCKSEAADTFIRSCYLGMEAPISGVTGYMRALFGNSKHRWMYDEYLLVSLLKEVGFVEIKRCEFGDSGNRYFDMVEEVGRFVDSGYSELAIEAHRPNHAA